MLSLCSWDNKAATSLGHVAFLEQRKEKKYKFMR